MTYLIRSRGGMYWTGKGWADKLSALQYDGLEGLPENLFDGGTMLQQSGELGGKVTYVDEEGEPAAVALSASLDVPPEWLETNPPSGQRVRCWAQSETPSVLAWAMRSMQKAGLEAELADEPGYVDVWFPASAGFVYGEDPVRELLDYLQEANASWKPERAHCRVIGPPGGGEPSVPKHHPAGKMGPSGPGMNPGTRVQSLLFEKASFSKQQAAAWAKSHGYVSAIEESRNFWRARQYEPAGERYRTITFGKGVKAIIGASGVRPAARQRNPLSEKQRAAALERIHKQWLLHDAGYYEQRGARAKPSLLTDEERQAALARIAARLEEKEQEKKGNPNPAPPSKKVKDSYLRFHGTEPSSVLEGRVWVPGGMVCVGPAIDIGYGIIDRKSSKDGLYQHDHKGGVKVYRRAMSGERPDIAWKSFPRELWVLGKALGFAYKDAETGTERQVKGTSKLKLATNASGNMLVVLDNTGVLFVVKGGRLRVTDWIRN